MKRVIVIANSKVLRAYRLGSPLKEDQIDFEISEIDLPAGKAPFSSGPEIDQRLAEIASQVKELDRSEHPDSWVLAAPLGILINLLPLIEKTVSHRLGSIKAADLVNLPTGQIMNYFGLQSLSGPYRVSRSTLPIPVAG